MELKQQNIMFFLRGNQHGGTENVVVQLCEILKPCVNKIVICVANGFDGGRIAELGIRLYHIPDLEDKTPVILYEILKTVDKIVQKEAITVVHTHHRMAAFYTYLLAQKHRFIFINTSHNTFSDKKLLTRIIYKHAHLVTCGEMVKRNLIDVYGLEEKKIKVIPNAVAVLEGEVVPVKKLQSRKEQGHVLVGNVGRLSEQKGMIYFIKSLPEVLRKHPNVTYVLIGGGEEQEMLMNLAKELHVSKNILFLGYRKDIQSLMTQLDFIVLSSLWEGLPLTPIEAFSVGKTVIGTAVDGTVEIIEDGKSGFLIPPKNSTEIAEKVIWMIEHPEERLQMERDARIRYQEKFTFEKFADSYIEFFERI